MSQDEISAIQVKAARALLAWSQQTLAQKANIAVSTVADFERGQRVPVRNNMDAIRTVIEAAGISFSSGGVVVGALPLLVAANIDGRPIRLIEAKDLTQWGERRDGQDTMPELLSNLAQTSGRVTQLRFPSGDSVQLGGWDGTCEVSVATRYLPAGVSAWEIGTQRDGIKGKAERDYKKRTGAPKDLDPSKTTFVFVTSRSWPEKEEWAKEKRLEGKWADVRVYDADDLVHWLELHPAVGLWLAIKIGKRPPGFVTLKEAWEEWSLSTEWPLTEELILSGRDQEAMRLLEWLREKPGVLPIQGESVDETIAFLHASISLLPPEYALAYHMRCVIAENSTAARMAGDSAAPLIIVMKQADPGLARRLSQRGHHIYMPSPFDDDNTPSGAVRLPRLSRKEMEEALIKMKIKKEDAEIYARDSARSLTILRRLIPSPASIAPRWAEAGNARYLVPALLAGSWDEDKAADRAAIEKIAGQPYDETVQGLVQWIEKADSPIQKAGKTWKMLSPRDAWFLLAPYLTTSDVDRFSQVILEVLGAPDPRFDIRPDERWMAATKGARPENSEFIRKGLSETLLLFSIFAKQARGVTNLGEKAQRIVRQLLENAPPVRWWSLSQDFRLLAETSPEEFLSAIDTDLNKNDPSIKVLFNADGGIAEREYISDLLWALETLAWSPRYFARVAEILIRLAAIDPNPNSRFVNRPMNSLREMFLLWAPQTYVPLDERLRVLDRLLKTDPKLAWRLMMGIFPKGRDVSSPSPLPRWRDFTVDNLEVVTYPLIAKGAEALSKRLIESVGLECAQWESLFQIIDEFPSEKIKQIIESFVIAIPNIQDSLGLAKIRAALREILYRNRKYKAAEWALTSEELAQIEKAYLALEPDDVIEKSAWLFSSDFAHLPNPMGSPEDYELDAQEVKRLQTEVVQSILNDKRDIDIIFSLAERTNAAWVGVAIAKATVDIELKIEILARALQSPAQSSKDLAAGIMHVLFSEDKKEWTEKLLGMANAQAWGGEAVVRILLTMPPSKETWGYVGQFDKSVQDSYWKRKDTLWIDGDGDEAACAIEKFIEAGRARHALALAHRSISKDISCELLMKTLEKSIEESWSDMQGGNEATMLRYYIEEILQHIDKKKIISNDRIAKVEWNLLPLLNHSRRPPIALFQELSSSPQLFVELLSAIYSPSEDSGIKEPPPEDREKANRVAERAYELFMQWDHLPGMKDGVLDAAVLENWVKQARKLCAEAGRADIGDQKIGEILSSSPIDTDGVWPVKAVRDVIEISRSQHLQTGISIGKYNRRGATVRGMTEGGAQERELVKEYRCYAEATKYDWPRTSALLETMARDYEIEAERHDHSATRSEWQD